jgi:hypothetical protein
MACNLTAFSQAGKQAARQTHSEAGTQKETGMQADKQAGVIQVGRQNQKQSPLMMAAYETKHVANKVI